MFSVGDVSGRMGVEMYTQECNCHESVRTGSCFFCFCFSHGPPLSASPDVGVPGCNCMYFLR